jgi:hypothetical protein
MIKLAEQLYKDEKKVEISIAKLVKNYLEAPLNYFVMVSSHQSTT